MVSEILSTLRARLLNTSTLAQESVRDGQTFFQSFFQNTIVENTPAFLLDNNFVRLLNFGRIATENAPAAVSVTGEDADIFNFRSGEIEALNGPDALATGIDVTGSADIRNFGNIAGEFNGVSFSGAQSSGSLDNFRGATVSSDSRAVNIQGDGVSVRNFGDIIGTGNQRNGTIYTDAVAENFSISNFSGGTIDAGLGNDGAGISLQVGDESNDVVSGTILNNFGGVIQGRGQAASNTPGAGDGIRVNNGAEGTVFDSSIVNNGLISSESNQGTAAGVRFADGVAFDGTLVNGATGIIEGVRNGVYFGDAEHDATVTNAGTIRSDSRAFNIDGSGIDLVNAGNILGTGDQRNGTVYSDDTARDFSITNTSTGVIDAGVDNSGSGISLSLAEEGNGDVSITNAGLIAGRGQASPAGGTAGDGIRLEGVRLPEGGFATGLFEGSIANSGNVTSEADSGPTGAFRAVNNVNFQGTLVNEESGVFAGVNNGVYFGTGDHDGGLFRNEGLVSSDSRALNIDGSGLTVENSGTILGTGNQRNGTVYADGTADNYTLTNTSAGVVDAGLGNNGSGVSLQTGDTNGDIVSGSVFNSGLIQGRGDSEAGNTIGDGLRVFSNVEDAGFAGVIQNEGTIAGSSESVEAAGIRIDGGVDLLGAILNEEDGVIRGIETAIDATEAGTVTIVNEGLIDGDVLLGDDQDILVDLGQVDGVVDGGAGDDVLILGEGDNVIRGGTGSDFIDGGEGFDTVSYEDLDVPVTVTLDANGNGTASRETGFSVIVENADIDPVQPLNIDGSGDFITEAINGNLYYNIHTSDFLGGEIRGQLLLASDTTEGHFRTVVIEGNLDAAQEPGPLSTSEATGFGRVTIVQDVRSGVFTYSSELSVEGIAESDLQTPIPGVVSAIHLHNAPAGINGPVIQDTLVDAGAVIDANVLSGIAESDVIENTIETDTLVSIENVIGSNDGDIITGSGQADNTFSGLDGNDTLLGGDGNDTLLGGRGGDTLEGGAGDDFVQGGGGSDITDGGEGIDTVSFADIGAPVTVDLAAGEAQYVAPNGNIIVDQVTNFENVLGSSNDDIIAGNSADNTLTGGLGDDVIDGGEGFDTADFSDLDVPVTVVLDENGNGTATRETGFSVSVGSTLVSPVQPLGGSQDFVTEAESGNLYFNIHTSDFLGGEIRGQLALVEGSDTRDEFGVGSFTIEGALDASQEPGPLSDSGATGFGSVTVSVAQDGSVSYTSELSVVGLAESDLQSPIPGVVSAIHLHNAPAGINGPVIQDTLVDAGASINGDVPSGVDGLDVIDNVIETDTLISIENVVGSDDGVVIDLAADAFTFGNGVESPAVSDFGLGELGDPDFAIDTQPTPEPIVEAPALANAFSPTNSFDGDEFTS